MTGATGYIGGRLVPELLAAGHTVRCLARNPAKLGDEPWRDRVEVVQGDVTDADVAGERHGRRRRRLLPRPLDGRRRHDFSGRDREAAADVPRRGGRGRRSSASSTSAGSGGTTTPSCRRHLRSRHEVGRVLADGPVPVTELRAAVIIGSGSASFEMLRYLVEVLPVMVTPRWVRNRCQPIAIRDVLAYLVAVLDVGGRRRPRARRCSRSAGPTSSPTSR